MDLGCLGGLAGLDAPLDGCGGWEGGCWEDMSLDCCVAGAGLGEVEGGEVCAGSTGFAMVERSGLNDDDDGAEGHWRLFFDRGLWG